MERHVKERLVGAAVLMAAAIILIPEMLSGPSRHENGATVARQPGETGLKTYTIDLNNPPGVNASSMPDDRAPPPEQPRPSQTPEASPPTPAQSAAPNPAQEDQTNPERVAAERSAQTAPTHTSGERTENAPASPPKKPDPAPTQPSTTPRVAESSQQSTSRPLASATNVPTTRGWAVQLGSFSSSASAERLAGEFRGSYGNVFVMPVKTASGTLYRVRIGPMKDRAAAEETLRRVRTKVSGAAIVAHP